MLETISNTRAERLIQRDSTDMTTLVGILVDAVNRQNPYITRDDLTKITKGIHVYKKDLQKDAIDFHRRGKAKDFKAERKDLRKIATSFVLKQLNNGQLSFFGY